MGAARWYVGWIGAGLVLGLLWGQLAWGQDGASAAFSGAEPGWYAIAKEFGLPGLFAFVAWHIAKSGMHCTPTVELGLTPSTERAIHHLAESLGAGGESPQQRQVKELISELARALNDPATDEREKARGQVRELLQGDGKAS